MLVYRIENAAGEGMYRAGKHPDCTSQMQNGPHHPTPWEDAKLSSDWQAISNRSAFSFGFGTVEQLKAWVYRMDWRQELQDAGFAMYLYDSTEVYTGDTQAVFIKTGPALMQTALTEI